MDKPHLTANTRKRTKICGKHTAIEKFCQRVIDDLTPGSAKIDRGNLSLLLVKTCSTTGAYSFTCNYLCTPN